MVRLQLRHDALQQAHQFTLRAHQLATQPAQCRRGVITHAAVAIDGSINGVFVALRGNQSHGERQQVRGRHCGAAWITQCRLCSTAGAQQRRDAGQLRALQRRADKPQARECLTHVGNRLRLPSPFGTEHRTHRLNPRQFGGEPFAIGSWTQRAHGDGA